MYNNVNNSDTQKTNICNTSGAGSESAGVVGYVCDETCCISHRSSISPHQTHTMMVGSVRVFTCGLYGHIHTHIHVIKP